MNIGILGTGLMGSALGLAWAAAGHQILFAYSRDPHKLEQLAQQAGNGAQAAASATAVAQADVVLISVLWHRLDDVLQQAGSLQGKVVLSCMLPMNQDDTALEFGLTTSGAEELARRTGARVISAFNTVWSDLIAARSEDQTPLSLLYVGDDAEAKSIAEGLIRDAGFAPVDAGALSNARLLEPFGLLVGQLGFAYNPLVAYRILNIDKRH